MASAVREVAAVLGAEDDTVDADLALLNQTEDDI